MPNKSKKNKVKTTSKRNPPANALSYHGRVLYPGEMEADQPIVVVSRYATDLVSSGAGVINTVFSNDPSGITDWASLVACFSEYRVLATALEFYPSNKYSKSVVVTKALCYVLDRSSSSALASFGNAGAYDSFRLLSLDDEFKLGDPERPAMIARMTSAEEAQWINTNSTSATWWQKFYTDGVSNSTTYGIVMQTFRLQFRGRR